jgi:predicted SAM-dependent methyltransferase
MDSLRWLRENTPPNPSRILEVGGRTEFTDHLTDQFKSSQIEQTPFDIRIPGWKLEDNTFDLILCMEVIEHLADVDSDPMEGNFYGDGIKACLKECFRVLKPGGYIFVTTPNLNSVAHLASLIYMEQVYAWEAHAYEMGFHKALRFVKDAGFNIIKAGTEDPWLEQKPLEEKQRRADAWTALYSVGANLKNRGEATFIIGRK